MQPLRPLLLFILFMAMILALFISRSALSIAMVLFVLVGCVHRDFIQQCRNFLSTPVLWSMSLLFFFPLISGLWSEDKKQWVDMLLIKLPLLFLPFAFAAPFNLSSRQWRLIAVFFISTVMIATGWSFIQYLADPAGINKGYLQSSVLVTPLENDHVRFSWLLVVAIILCGWLFTMEKRKTVFSWLFIFLGVLLIGYLHLLAARTGLLCLYISMFCFCAWLIFRSGNRKYGVALLVICLSLPVVAFLLVPSFQNRIKYMQYEMEYFSKAHYLPGGNDPLRIISLKAGWELLKKEPVMGVGFGDIGAETRNWYDANYPGIWEKQKIYPSSEWLMYGAGCGIPGICVFTLVVLIPFFERGKWITWFLLNISAAVAFTTDIALEVQFGVFAWSFTVLWWWKWMKEQKI
jgi:O-antigen ligase